MQIDFGGSPRARPKGIGDVDVYYPAASQVSCHLEFEGICFLKLRWYCIIFFRINAFDSQIRSLYLRSFISALGANAEA